MRPKRKPSPPSPVETYDRKAYPDPRAGPAPPLRDKGARKAWADLPRFPHSAHRVDVGWPDLPGYVAWSQAEYGLDMDPDYQRAHVWSEARQRAYVEYNLSGGEVSRTITFVCHDWWGAVPVPGYAVLDGKQRVEAALRFMRGDLRVFPDVHRPAGYAFQDFEGHPRVMQGTFSWAVVVVPDRLATLELYLAFNRGGIAHTESEIARVEALRDAELARLAREGGGRG